MKEFFATPIGLTLISWIGFMLLAIAVFYICVVNAGEVDQNGRWIKPSIKKKNYPILNVDFSGLLFGVFILLLVYFILKLNCGN